MDVKIKDREEDVELLRGALNLAELGVSYIQADLILRVQKVLNKKKGNFKISDGVDIRYEWGQYWQSYFQEQEKNNKQNKK